MPENCSAKSLPVAARQRRRVGGQHGIEPVVDLAEDAAPFRVKPIMPPQVAMNSTSAKVGQRRLRLSR